MNGNEIDAISLMFEAARSFIGGAKIIITSEGIEEDGVVKLPTLPVVVCSAIAIEIQFKALLQAADIQRPRGDGHDLCSLFEALPPELQSTLLSYQVPFTETPPDRAKTLLSSHRNAFKDWRYPYETAELNTSPAFLLSFALALSEYMKATFVLERSDNGWLKSTDESNAARI
jgi:hypothetical protein